MSTASAARGVADGDGDDVEAVAARRESELAQLFGEARPIASARAKPPPFVIVACQSCGHTGIVRRATIYEKTLTCLACGGTATPREAT
jgi:ribosomal protein S27E